MNIRRIITATLLLFLSQYYIGIADNISSASNNESTSNDNISATDNTSTNSDNVDTVVKKVSDASKAVSDQYRKMESNPYRRAYPNAATTLASPIVPPAPLPSQTVSNSQVVASSKQAVQDLAVKEGEGLTQSEKLAVAKKTYDSRINNALNIDAIKTSFFNGFRVSETFSHAMLNVQQDTGDPLFMLQARQQGILEDNYVYVGAKAVARDRQPTSGKGNGSFSYYADTYVATTISKWVSTLLGFAIYQDHDTSLNLRPSTIYFIVGDLSESPVFGYVGTSTLMFGNFDIVSNYVPTLTRLYFMQAGGNVNISYHTDSLHLNAILLNTNPDSYFGVSNAQSNSGVGLSLNSKYIYEMDNVGDYQFLGLAYSNVSGFSGKNGSNVGSIDLNYGLSISDINFELEGLITDSGVTSINKSSSISPNNISGVPFFGSIMPSNNVVYDNFLGSGDHIGTWSVQSSYTASVYDKRLIPYVQYSQIYQNSNNYAYEYGAGARYNVFFGSWVGLDYTSVTTNSENNRDKQNYLSVNYTIYI